MPNLENNVSRAENMWDIKKRMERKLVLPKCFEFVGKHSFFLGSKFCFRNNMFPVMGKQGVIDRKHNVSATTFPS